ncbi:MAG: OmpA family protein [Verrucomicrobiota bacterium]
MDTHARDHIRYELISLLYFYLEAAINYRMNSSVLSLCRYTLLLLAVASFSACTRNIEKDDRDGGFVAGDEEPIYELPVRTDATNPENADYSTLENYTVYFDFDSYSIRASERPKLEAIAAWLNENSGAKVVMAGHTDDRGTTQYNLGLGERRAIATRDYLLGLGIDVSRISTVSYGEERPAQSGSGESAYSANRRTAVGVLR